MNRLVLASAAVLFTASGALAGGLSTLETNQAVQAQRIEQGRVAGALTKKEYRTLKTEQAEIQGMQDRALANGHLSRSEYNRIHDAQLQAYQDIKTDGSNGKVNYLRRWLWNHR